ncbi:HD domain-containing phosphohydrolase [Candidatus Oscillochloris fontis]|uniref:HD domain-containing phosphohydrolase n=1 Tax=Candidatus Oscillochloris fontis TaxID=2496868 RepID=UPI00101C86FB|nr:HD domain-containing phosphohydrolase [Candidatus Oscillochloris fontis]
MSELLINATTTQRPRILVVEDDTTIRTFCQRLLQMTYDVTTAENGAVAVNLLHSHSFDLVLTDMQMPLMDGMQLLQHIRQNHPEIDVVMLTAFATVETARQALKMGALDYLSKPIEAEQLERTVRTSLELRRIRQEKERLSDLVFMYQFSQMIATSLDIETQVDQIVEFLWQRFAPEALALSMHMTDTGKLHLLAMRSAAGWGDLGTINLPAECSDQQLLAAHMRLAGGPGTNDESLFAGTLLRSHDTPIGYLHMARRSEQPHFDASERRLIGIFATQIATSLDNARLYQALKDQNRQTIEALTEAIEARDAYTYGHSRQVTRYAIRLAQELDLPPERIELIDYAGLLHDVGKIGIRDYVLLKPGALSDEEFDVMKRHPGIGVKIIERVRGLRATLPIIEYHHERVDGKGYPRGLKSEEIPLEARILAIADSFEAMTSDRAYRPAMEPERALRILIEGRGTHWDPELVDRFVDIIRREGERLKVSTKPLRQKAMPIEQMAPPVGEVRDVRD